jgi:exodeoxyribonuclease-5
MDRSRKTFQENLRRHFGFEPTESQAEAMDQLADFIYGKGDNFLFQLTGYAGTGKTSLVSALVKALTDIGVHIVMLAPTGRAAKVLSQYAGRKAYTIHKWIYRVSSKEGIRRFVRRENKDSHTLFIVDEASMISAQGSLNDLIGNSLLDDLMEFVYLGDSNRMLFVGDDAQLPPVHADESPALDASYLRNAYDVQVFGARLTDVVRQSLDSGILYNATKVRDKINAGDYTFPLFSGQKFEDFRRIDGGEMEELLNKLYNDHDSDEIVLVTRSNKRAFLFNNAVRSRVLFRENVIATGDYIMAVKNNYYWLDELSEAGFLANGDIMEIMSINKQQELYGFHFADITARLCDYPEHPYVDMKIILESLDCDGPSLSHEANQKLYQAVAEDYMDIVNPRARFLKIKEDPYLNAVQVKFAYALTCHKTQGGQWSHVLIDQGFLPDNTIDKEYLRWMYTAVTRSTQYVYLLNFCDEAFEQL